MQELKFISVNAYVALAREMVAARRAARFFALRGAEPARGGK